jgi:hypothetical protein
MSRRFLMETAVFLLSRSLCATIARKERLEVMRWLKMLDTRRNGSAEAYL